MSFVYFGVLTSCNNVQTGSKANLWIRRLRSGVIVTQYTTRKILVDNVFSLPCYPNMEIVKKK